MITKYQGKLDASMFSNSGLVHFEIARDECESLDFTRLEEFLDQLVKLKKLPCQRVILTFNGYSDDKRELLYIPSVVKYAKHLCDEYPFIFYYLKPYENLIFISCNLVTSAPYAVFKAGGSHGIVVDPKQLGNLWEKMKRDIATIAGHFKDKDGGRSAILAWDGFIMSKYSLTPNMPGKE